MHKNYIIIISIPIIFYLQSCTSLQNLFTSVFKESGDILIERMQEEGWDTEVLDTARNVSYLTEVEKDVVLLHNAVRSDPKKFNELYVKEIKDFHHGEEGSVASKELYQTLQKQASLPILQPSKGMSLASADHAKDQSLTGEWGHTGSDGSSPSRRVNRYGTGSYVGENISYGHNDAFQIMLSLLVDDGVPSRVHTKNILHKEYHSIGVGCDTHLEYGASCTINYAREYQELKSQYGI